MILSRNQDKLNLTLSLAIPPVTRIVCGTSWRKADPGSREELFHTLSQAILRVTPDPTAHGLHLPFCDSSWPREYAEELTGLVATQKGARASLATRISPNSVTSNKTV